MWLSWLYGSWIYYYLCNLPITTNVMSTNPARARSTRYNIIWFFFEEQVFYAIDCFRNKYCHILYVVEILTTHLDEPWTRHFQLGLAKVFKFYSGGRGGYIAITLSVRSHFRNRYLSFYWKKWFYIWYMALAWWLVLCLPFPGLPHIYFLFTTRLRIFHVCRNENFRNRYLSFYWKKWFYIWYMALAWWIVPCLPFPGLLHLRIFHVFSAFSGNECWDIYKFDTNERMGVFLALRCVQHLVFLNTGITFPATMYLLSSRFVLAKITIFEGYLKDNFYC